MDIVDTSDAHPRGLWVFREADIGNTNGKTEKNTILYTKFMVLDNGLSVLLAAPGVRIGGGHIIDRNVIGLVFSHIIDCCFDCCI